LKLPRFSTISANGIPELNPRKPGRLDPDEYTLMKKHPEYGWRSAGMLPGISSARARHSSHHEDFDGKGYPAGLQAPRFPSFLESSPLIDAFDAMFSSRPYRVGFFSRRAVRRLIESSGTQFDTAVVAMLHLPSRKPRLGHGFCRPPAPSVSSALLGLFNLANESYLSLKRILIGILSAWVC